MGMLVECVGAASRPWPLLADGRALDAIIADLQMPDMDGLVLAGEIRKLAGRAATCPLLLLSCPASAAMICALRRGASPFRS